MAVALALGGLLLHVNPPNWKAPWLHMKLTAVMLLVIAEGLHGKGLCQKKTRGSGRWLALFVITSLLVLGVLASVYIMKPKFELAWGLNGFYPG